MTRVATFTKGTPVALATNGTVREARGLASNTNTWSAAPMPYCLTAKLHVDEPHYIERVGDLLHMALQQGHGGLR